MQVGTGVEVAIDYQLYIDGELMDETAPGAPLRYIHGSGQIIPGLERALSGLKVGDETKVTVQPEEGYGHSDSQKVVQVPREQFPHDVEPQEGMGVQVTSADGEILTGAIREVDGEMITVDFNHPLAGKTLIFDVKVVDIAPVNK